MNARMGGRSDGAAQERARGDSVERMGKPRHGARRVRAGAQLVWCGVAVVVPCGRASGARVLGPPFVQRVLAARVRGVSGGSSRPVAGRRGVVARTGHTYAWMATALGRGDIRTRRAGSWGGSFRGRKEKSCVTYNGGPAVLPGSAEAELFWVSFGCFWQVGTLSCFLCLFVFLRDPRIGLGVENSDK